MACKIVFKNCIQFSLYYLSNNYLPIYLPTYLRTSLSFLSRVSEELHNSLEWFTCNLYGKKSCSEVNEARYQLFCSRRGKIESSHLPPHHLRKHIDRANYQVRVWRICCEQFPVIQELQNHGSKYHNVQLAIDWMTILPAPETYWSFYLLVAESPVTIINVHVEQMAFLSLISVLFEFCSYRRR